MKWAYSLVFLLLLLLTLMLWRGKEAPVASLGSPPQASKPYNILDYTKPAVKP